MSKFTARQEIFIAEYVKVWNASEAARRAGYNGRSNTAGNQLLSNTDIAAEIERRKALLIMAAEEVAVRLTEQGRAGYAEYFNEHGGVDLDRLLRDGKGHLIKKIKPTKEGIEIEFYDAQTALSLLAKINGQLRDRTELTGKNGGDISVRHSISDELTAAIQQVYGSGDSESGDAESD